MTDATQRLEHIALEVPPGAAFESQSGLQLNRPKIYGALSSPPDARHAALVMHPSSNFMNHYLLAPLAERNIALLALNTRYCNGDSVLIMERAIQDVGAGVKFLRSRGYKTVTLIGNSGGASLMAFYQSQAESLNVTHTPAGDPVDLRPEQLPPADGMALIAGHPGRGTLMLNYIDGSVIDERDPLTYDPVLDIYNRENGPPFSEAFVAAYRAAQRRRSEAITNYAQRRLRFLRAIHGPDADEAFIVYRTYADPRFIDISLDANDRVPGGNRGASPKQANESANNLGRFTTLTSWLSQWSLLTNADGPSNMARTSVPVVQVEYTADAGIFPSDVKAWSDSAAGRITNHRLPKATHYMKNQPQVLGQVSDLLAEWIGGLG